VSGSSCLLVALARAVLGEASLVLGASQAQILWDITKFYDSIDPGKMAGFAGTVGYPLMQLYLGLLMHQAARFILDNGQASDFLVPGASILAGCTQSTSWAKVYLHDLLQKVHDDFIPVRLSSWIDDLHQMMLGSRSEVVRLMADAAGFLQQGLAARSCHFAPKSFVLSTSQGLSSQASQALIAKGIVLDVKVHGRDLGLDTTLGRRRRVGMVALRARAARARMVSGGQASQAGKTAHHGGSVASVVLGQGGLWILAVRASQAHGRCCGRAWGIQARRLLCYRF